ncbi:hypothetical protein D7Y09_14110 [bacterium 1XD42-1]|nr:hypothetical protein D7X25_18680 [bacterium 1XD42-8]RKJ62294.1 hypothetical protein D7Y09_14110 [bacterium 1XD42-1]
MNKKELSQLYSLNKEIEQEKKRLADLEAAEAGIAVNIKGLPHIGIVSDKTAIAAEIADCKAVIEAKAQACIAEYNRINRYIASIDNSSMRQVLTLRFVDGLSWNQVACGIGGRNTADSVRKACERFLNEN